MLRNTLRSRVRMPEARLPPASDNSGCTLSVRRFQIAMLGQVLTSPWREGVQKGEQMNPILGRAFRIACLDER